MTHNVSSGRGAPDLDQAGYEQSGSGQLDLLPCSSTNHCKHALCFITQCQESVKSLNRQEIHGTASQHITKLSFMIRCFDIPIGCNSA